MPLVHRCVANLRYRGREYGDLATVTGVKTDREEREVTFSTDAYGFRNESSDPGQTRPLDVILLGGSMPDGANTTQEDILSSLLSRDYGYQTYNLSMGASRPWENYVNLSLEIDRLPIKPQRTVVLWVLVADIRELDEPCHRNLDTAKLPWNDWLGSLMVSYQTLRRYSPVHQFISRAVIRLRYGRLARESWVLRRNFLDGRMLLFASRDPEPKGRSAEDLLHHPNFPCFRATFSAMKRLADQKNLKVAIVLVPNKAGVYSWVLDNGPPWSTTLDPSDFSIVLKQISDQEGFYFFDLKPFFVEASRRAWEDSRGLIWWHDDMHWNARGHKEAASVIYSKVLCLLLPVH